MEKELREYEAPKKVWAWWEKEEEEDTLRQHLHLIEEVDGPLAVRFFAITIYQ